MPKTVDGVELLNGREVAERMGMSEVWFHQKKAELVEGGVLDDRAPWPGAQHRYVIVTQPDRKEVG